MAPSTRVLDVGCGNGVLLARLRAERQCQCLGLDISTVAISNVCRQRMGGVVASVPAIPFADGSFDVVIATELLEHLAVPLDTLRQMSRVVKPGGMIVCTVPNHCFGPHECFEHLQEFDRDSFRRLLEPFGVVHVADVTDLGHSRLMGIVERVDAERAPFAEERGGA